MDPGETQPTADDINLVAELIGTTDAGLKQIDQQIVSSSTNLQKSHDSWDPKQLMQTHIQQMQGSLPVQQPVQIPPAGVSPEVQMHAPAPVNPGQPMPPSAPIQGSITIDNTEQLNRIEAKLDSFLSQIQTLTTLDKKLNNFVERGLKDRVKQITLKLDDTNNTKQS